MNSQKGFIEELVFLSLGVVILAVILLSIFSRWERSEDNVSGIVYNTENNKVISGNTTFSIRAGENTPVTAENQSSYCLPPNSPYKELVNQAAGDKRIKVQVTTRKGFWWKAPWTCVDYVTVTRVEE